MEELTHKDLIEKAAEWLRPRSAIVITEMTTTGEEPDAIGFTSRHTILVECKATRADFLCDQKKFYRRSPEHGMGNERYYFCPKGLIEDSELPEKWGLIEVDMGKIRIKRKPEWQEKDSRREQALLVSAMRRIGAHAQALSGVSVKAYTYETKNRATLGIELEGKAA